MKKTLASIFGFLVLAGCDSSSTQVSPPGGDVGCLAPLYGTVIDRGNDELTDGCTNGTAFDIAAITDAESFHLLQDGQLDFDSATASADVKGLYLYTDGSSPAFVASYTQVGYYYRAGNLGFVTGGPGVYYLPFDREQGDAGMVLNGIGIAAWAVAEGDAVQLTEVTLAHVDDDVSAVPKLHWQKSGIVDSANYSSRNLITLAAGEQPLRNLTHALSEEILGEYVDLISSVCPTIDGGHSEPAAIRFVDASGVLGHAWQGRDLHIRTTDDLSRPLFVVSIDWSYATQASVAEIVATISSKSYLWPNSQHPNMQDGSCPAAVSVNFDVEALRQQALDGDLGAVEDWSH